MFNFALNLTTTYTFWAGVLGGTFLTMASHGQTSSWSSACWPQRTCANRASPCSPAASSSSSSSRSSSSSASDCSSSTEHIRLRWPDRRGQRNRIFPAFIVQPDARRHRRPAGRRHPRRRHVEPQCGPELAFVHHRRRLLHGLPPHRRRPRAHDRLARLDRPLGAGALRRRRLLGTRRRQRQRRRDRPLHRLRRLRLPARRLPPRHPHALRYARRSNHRHDHRLRTEHGSVAATRRSPHRRHHRAQGRLDLVRPYRSHRHLRHWLARQPHLPQAIHPHQVRRHRCLPHPRHPERSVAPLRRAVEGPRSRPPCHKRISHFRLEPQLPPPPPTSPPPPPQSTPPSPKRNSPAPSSSSATTARSSSSRPTESANTPANPDSTANPPPPNP